MPVRIITSKHIISKVETESHKVTVFPGEPLEQYLRAPFTVEYDGEIDLRELDLSVLTTPFILNVAPLIWVLGEDLHLDVMDQDLFFSLEKIREGFRKLYPDVPWGGDLIPGNLATATIPEPQSDLSQVLFFSGGVDSTHSALQCDPEKTVLLAIRGHDISLDNDQAWNIIRKQNRDFADTFHFGTREVYANTFRLLRCGGIHLGYPQLKPWYGKVQHGIGLAGLAFPLAVYNGWKKILFSSSVGTRRLNFAWGSHVFLEPNLKASGIQTDYTGANLIWPEKVSEIVSFYRQNPHMRKATLRVCLDEMSGKATGNCGHCEKCLRGIMALMVNSEDPSDWGFPMPEHLDELKNYISGLSIPEHRRPYWDYSTKCIMTGMANGKKEYSDLLLWFQEWYNSLKEQE